MIRVWCTRSGTLKILTLRHPFLSFYLESSAKTGFYFKAGKFEFDLDHYVSYYIPQ